MDQLDSRYKDLREQLYTLGFSQQLPIGSMSLVSDLLEDLIKVTDSYKQSKETVKNLLEEKAAWDLGIEPYKCDNSRLLSENNALHLEVIIIRGNYEKKIVDLNNTIRNLEVDKNYLDDHCFELVSKIRDMEQQRGKNVNGSVQHKKAFVSTVRSVTPPLPSSPIGRHHTSRQCDRKRNNEHVEYIKLQNDIQLLKDETGGLKKQLESRDLEISRLHKQLTGGRPVAALGRDCCYRGIETLTEDMKLLQQQLIATKKELAESLKHQHEAKHRAILLAEEKSKFANDLRDMEEIALKVEEEANAKLMAKEKQLQNLENKLAEALRKIALLEAGGHSLSSTSQQSKTVQNLKAALKKTNDENDNLIERLINDETKYQEQIKILSRKNAKLEDKLRILQEHGSSKKSEKRLLSKATLTDPQIDSNSSKEKILLQAEYLRRLNQPVYERELENVQAQLSMREIEIHSLKEQLSSQQQNAAAYCHTSASVQSVMNRMERETEALKLKIEHMTTERDELKKNLQEVTDAYHNEQLSCAEQTLGLSNKIKQLENDNRALRDSKHTGASVENRISRMNEEIKNYSQQLDELNAENRKLKASYSQIRMLQEQTEKSLLDYQSRLFQTENQLAQTASERGAIDAKFDYSTKTINNLKMESAKLKSIIEEIEEDRNEMHNLLDTKTEKMCHLEAEISQLRADNAELSSKSLALQRQMSNKSHENVEKTSTIQKVTQETEVLRKQIEHLKGLNENLTTENSRLNHEITDLECACKELKKKQRVTSTESIRLEESIREYVKKVKMLEDVIASKEMERTSMLDHFNELENDANALERTNRSLEEENLETKRYLTETEHKLHHLQEILNQRDNEIVASDRQITQLNNHIAEVERELKRREEEVAVVQANAIANKEVCSKLDIEKKKLNEELNEAANIRRQLEGENEKLRKDLAATAALDQQTAVQNLQEALTARKREVEQLRATVSEKSTENQKLRFKIEEFKEKIEEEHENSERYKALSQENSVQIQELRCELTKLRHTVSERSKEQIQKEDYDRHKKQPKSESQTGIFELHARSIEFSGATRNNEKEEDRNQVLYEQISSGSRADPLKSPSTFDNKAATIRRLNHEITDLKKKQRFESTESIRLEDSVREYVKNSMLEDAKEMVRTTMPAHELENDANVLQRTNHGLGVENLEKKNQVLYEQTPSGSRADRLKSTSTFNRPISKEPKLRNESISPSKVLKKSHIEKDENERNKISTTSSGSQTYPFKSTATNSDHATSRKLKSRNDLISPLKSISKPHIRKNQNKRHKNSFKHNEIGNRAEPSSKTNILNYKKSKPKTELTIYIGKDEMEENQKNRSENVLPEPTKFGNRTKPLKSPSESKLSSYTKSKSETELIVPKADNKTQVEKEAIYRQVLHKLKSNTKLKATDNYHDKKNKNGSVRIMDEQTLSSTRADPLKTTSLNSDRLTSKKSKGRYESTFPPKAIGKSHIQEDRNKRNKNSPEHTTISNRAEPSSKTILSNFEKSKSKAESTLSEVFGKNQIKEHLNDRNNIPEPKKIGNRTEPIESKINNPPMEKGENDCAQTLYESKLKTELKAVADCHIEKDKNERYESGNRSKFFETTHDSNSISPKSSKAKTELNKTQSQAVNKGHKEKVRSERRIDPFQPLSTISESTTSKQSQIKASLTLSKDVVKNQKENDENDCNGMKVVSNNPAESFEAIFANSTRANSKHVKSSDSHFTPIHTDEREDQEYVVVVDNENEFLKSNSTHPNSNTMKSKSSDSDFIADEIINEIALDKKENDRDKILRTQTTSGSGSDFSESLKTNSDTSPSPNNLGSNISAAEIHSMKALFRRSSPSDTKSSVPNPKRKLSDEDSLESTDELTAMHVHFSKNPNPTKRIAPTSLTLRKEDSNNSNMKNKLYKKMSSENESKAQLENSYIESVDRSQDSPEVPQTRNEFLDNTLPSIQTSYVVNQDKVSNYPLQESSMLATRSRPESNKEKSTSNNSRSSSAPRSSLKQSNFNCSHLPPPPPPFKRSFTFGSDRSSEVITVVSHIPIKALSYGVTPIK